VCSVHAARVVSHAGVDDKKKRERERERERERCLHATGVESRKRAIEMYSMRSTRYTPPLCCPIVPHKTQSTPKAVG
jgi:hypothetical protein